MSVRFNEKMKAQAQTRLWVKWRFAINGYTDMVYYSFETAKSLREQDSSYGMDKLSRMVQSTHLEGKYEIAIIYDNKTGAELMRFKNGSVISTCIR